MSASAHSAVIFGPTTQNRALALCVLASLALHALVLLLPGLRPGAPAAPATRMLTAKFAPRIAPEEPAPVAPDSGKRFEPEPLRPPPRPAPDPAPAVISAPAAAPPAAPAAPGPVVPRAAAGPAAPAPPAEPPAAPAGIAPGTTATRPADAQPAAAAPGRGRVESDADAGTLDQYRLALIGVARRYKRYPAQAMDRGWQGKVEVRLVVGANGTIQSSLIKASSGYEFLDNQALDMVKKAKPLTPIPAALRGREFTVDIPVIFELQAG